MAGVAGEIDRCQARHRRGLARAAVRAPWLVLVPTSRSSQSYWAEALRRTGSTVHCQPTTRACPGTPRVTTEFGHLGMAWCAVRRTRYAGLQRGARVGVVIVLVLRTGVGMWSAYGWKGVVVALLERGAGLLLKPLQEQLAERLAPCCLRHVEVRCVRGGLALHP